MLSLVVLNFGVFGIGTWRVTIIVIVELKLIHYQILDI